jgi:hypothetical protein
MSPAQPIIIIGLVLLVALAVVNFILHRNARRKGKASSFLTVKGIAIQVLLLLAVSVCFGILAAESINKDRLNQSLSVNEIFLTDSQKQKLRNGDTLTVPDKYTEDGITVESEKDVVLFPLSDSNNDYQLLITGAGPDVVLEDDVNQIITPESEK